MADYVTGTSGSRTGLYVGIGAVALVVLLALFAFGSGTTGTPPADDPGAAAVEPAAPAVTDTAPAIDGAPAQN